MTVDELKRQLARDLTLVSDNALFEARQIIQFALNIEANDFILDSARAINEAEVTKVFHLMKRRLAGEPLAYLIGSWQFRQLNLTVSEKTLIPRPETELIIDIVLARKPKVADNAIDLGTGTGAIALALKQEVPNLNVYATDISKEALMIAQQNARLNDLSVEFILSDWWQEIPKLPQFDIITANPPYIAREDQHIDASVRAFEPELALFSDKNGLAAIEAIIAGSLKHMTTHGLLIIEHGHRQSDTVREKLIAAGFTDVQIHQDQYQQERFTSALKD